MCANLKTTALLASFPMKNDTCRLNIQEKVRRVDAIRSEFPSHFIIQITWKVVSCFVKPSPYLCQARVCLQDSYYEIQRLLLQEGGRPSPHAHRPHLLSIRGSTLQEKEKQRSLEKQKEEVAMIHHLQDQLRQEKECWERECQARESQQAEWERSLEERERKCHLEAEKLQCEREDLDEQLEEYQQGLERLRDGQRNIKREREWLENQEKLLQTWRHSRQRSLPTMLPHMLIPLDGQQVGAGQVPCLSDDCCLDN